MVLEPGWRIMIRFLAKFFRGLHLIFGVSAPPEGQNETLVGVDLARRFIFSGGLRRAPLLPRALPVLQTLIFLS